jgi:hypothetical protein
MDIKTWTILCACIIVAAVFLTGCIGQKAQTEAQTEPPSILVTYERTGGVAGLDDRLVIFDNGVGVLMSRSGSTEISLSKLDMARINALFSEAQFSMLQTNYTVSRPSADLVKYSVGYHGKTVTVQDTAIPPSLQPVLNELDRFVNSASNQMINYSLVRVKI